MNFPKVTIELPEWVDEFLQESDDIFACVESRMQLAINLARKNIEHKTGGPFGAAVFDQNGRLIAPGINLVTTSNCSILHAEMVALALAQKAVGRFDLSDSGEYSYDLVASTEPCAMCFGAVPWSGVKRLICGARDEDARRIGFDEGPKLLNWKEELENRGISVIRDVLRSDATAVLNTYAGTGGRIYNPGPGQHNNNT
jgi:tRNA(Arg) A34 adenosine deaminase TadA